MRLLKINNFTYIPVPIRLTSGEGNKKGELLKENWGIQKKK